MNDTKFSKSGRHSSLTRIARFSAAAVLVLVSTLAVLALTLVAAPHAEAQATETILYNFTGGNDGGVPESPLVADATGNLYGTTYQAGVLQGGMAFELSPQAGGGWSESPIYSFYSVGGRYPVAGLIIDAAGHLYGTTFNGGNYAYGAVFELIRQSANVWSENVLHSFNNTNGDGYNPSAGLIFDSSGNIYGTTTVGGAYNQGTVFVLRPGPSGTWHEQILHSFGGTSTDGIQPNAAVTLGPSGNLYGTTSFGGAHNAGTVFALTPKVGGWTEHIVHSFNKSGNDGYEPYAGVIFDSAGNLYGTTDLGGLNGAYLGTVYKLSPKAGGAWTETILHSFTGGSDGAQPYAEKLIFDAAGNLYGTTLGGGPTSNGTVFKLSASSGTWTETVLYTFGASPDGNYPYAGLMSDAAGNLYGTTFAGGANGYGTIFEIAP